MGSAPREAPWGAPGGVGAFDNLTAVVGSARAAHRDAPRSARGTAFPERSPPGLGLAGAGAGACSRLVLAAWSRLQCLFRAWEPELQLRDAPASTFPEPPPRRGGLGGHSGRPGSSWDPGHSTLGVLHPTSGLPLLVRPPSRPSWGPEATQVHPGRGHSLWEWAGGGAQLDPAWPEQLGPDGKKGGCPQLPQAGAGLGRNATAHEGPAGHPTPITWVRPWARGAPPAWPGPGGARSRPTVAGSEDC